jgi:nuclear transport factor 2 (NTF2) superfamily protein
MIDTMKLKELMPNIGEREAVRFEYRKLDKNGRAYFGPSEANKEYIVALIEAVPEDKIKFLKVGRG